MDDVDTTSAIEAPVDWRRWPVTSAKYPRIIVVHSRLSEPYMARRRSRLARNLIVLALLAAAAFAAWRFAPESLRGAFDRDGSRTVVAGGLNACTMAAPEVLAQMIGRVAVEPRRTAPAQGVPAASTCTWVFFGGQVVGRAFSVDSLRAGSVNLGLSDYYRSIVTGLEYEFKQVPATVIGIGEEAVAAGFDGGTPPQMVVLGSDLVLTLEVAGIDRATTEAFARALLANR